jgi:RNA polymerase sigma-70 factor, ECF subfamily
MTSAIRQSEDYSELDDGDLMRRVARRQGDALAELYDRYHRLVFDVAYHIVSDLALAEEVTQEAFFRAWTHATEYDPALAQVNTWLVSIARHRAIDVVRRRRVRPEHHGVSWGALHAEDEPRVEGAEQSAEAHFAQSHVREALASLPAEQRVVLALAYFQGMTQQEIAAVLDEPLGTVKTRIRLGMRKLRRMLVDAV